jgi:hypothetical protein
LADVYARNRSRAGTYTSGDRGKTWSNTGNALTRGEAKAAGFGYRTENGTVTITGYTGSVKDVVIPNRINNKLVTAIGDGAFANNRLSSVFIPNGVTVIGNSAFRDNQLTHLAIGNGVTAIGDGAFASNSLTSVSIPNSVTAIGVEAFADNRLTSVLIPNGVAVIGVRAFRTNQLTHLAIGSGVTAIGDLAFAANRLTRVTIPSGVTTIGNDAFLYNQLDSVTIPANVDIQPSSFYRLLYAHYAAAGRKAAVYTFERSASGDFETVTSNNTVEITGYTGSAKDVTIPARIDNQPVIAIGEGAFYNSQLTSVLIPDGVTAIGFGAFEGNRLTSVTIGANVEISRFASFPGDLEDVYTDKGKLAGTYTSGDGGKTWTRQ